MTAKLMLSRKEGTLEQLESAKRNPIYQRRRSSMHSSMIALSWALLTASALAQTGFQRTKSLMGGASAVALADGDGDGDRDWIIGNAGGSISLQLNDGDGRFTDVSKQRMPILQIAASAFAVGDVDGDQDLDILVAGGYFGFGVQDALLLNNGKGVFSLAPTKQLPRVSDPSSDVALVDIDNDGDPDLVLGSGLGLSGGRPNGVYTNNGKGFFTRAPKALPSVKRHTRDAVLRDFDGDGDPDLCVGTTPVGHLQPSNRSIYVNLRRQLVATSVPYTGSPYSIDLWAMPKRALAWTFVSLGRGKFAIPGIGTFMLDPTVMVQLPVQILSENAKQTLRVTVPADRRLIGQRVSAQAIYWEIDRGRFGGFSNTVSHIVK